MQHLSKPVEPTVSPSSSEPETRASDEARTRRPERQELIDVGARPLALLHGSIPKFGRNDLRGILDVRV